MAWRLRSTNQETYLSSLCYQIGVTFTSENLIGRLTILVALCLHYSNRKHLHTPSMLEF